MEKLFKLLTLLALVSTQLATSALASNAQTATRKGPQSADPYAGLRIQVGIWQGADVINKNYYADATVQDVFTKNEALRANMPGELPNDFNEITKSVHSYIESINDSGDEASNGVLNSELSRRIVRASFCFGTDAKMIAAKIRMESMFNRKAVSPTGAVGFSQMTSSGMEEANDQLGNRGPKNAPEGNAVYFKQAIRCYLGKDLTMMWEAGVITKGQTLSGSRLAAAKKWLIQDLDRDLIYGQIVLKTNLAAVRNSKNSMLTNYSMAFVRYNGDNKKVKGGTMKNVYAQQVLSYYKNIGFDPTGALNFKESTQNLESFDHIEVYPWIRPANDSIEI